MDRFKIEPVHFRWDCKFFNSKKKIGNLSKALAAMVLIQLLHNIGNYFLGGGSDGY